MKYVILHGDGMGDWAVESLGGKTPLEAARTPNLDRLASHGELGLIHTIPEGLPPGSDVGSLTLFGFNPREVYTGRSPIEAASMGIELGLEDVAFRCNLVNLSFDPADGADAVMADFTSGHITTEEAREVVLTLQNELGGRGIEFHPGVSYRHCMVWRNGEQGMSTTPPHDISDRPIGEHLPKGEGSDLLRELMLKSRTILADHPVNTKRIAAGQKPVTQIWLWGQGRRPRVQSYAEKFGLGGTVVSAVDLVKGLGVLCGLNVPDIEGATGWIDTNCENKVAAALTGLETSDFAYVHLEAPDEAGHQGDAEKKVMAIEMFDERIVGPMLRGLEKHGAFRVLVSPDHATPVSIKTHSPDASPFIFFDSQKHLTKRGDRGYNETDARASGLVIKEGYTLWNSIVTGGDLLA
jgi:2,3-bisphosphoglycerate-independent phosphoglycerate mutase